MILFIHNVTKFIRSFSLKKFLFVSIHYTLYLFDLWSTDPFLIGILFFSFISYFFDDWFFSGLQLSRLGLGSYYTFGTKILDQSCVNEILKCSLDLGINHFDTAEIYGYGRSEEMLGSAFKHSGVRRSDFCIASKVCIYSLKV